MLARIDITCGPTEKVCQTALVLVVAVPCFIAALRTTESNLEVQKKVSGKLFSSNNLRNSFKKEQDHKFNKT